METISLTANFVFTLVVFFVFVGLFLGKKFYVAIGFLLLCFWLFLKTYNNLANNYYLLSLLPFVFLTTIFLFIPDKKIFVKKDL